VQDEGKREDGEDREKLRVHSAGGSRNMSLQTEEAPTRKKENNEAKTKMSRDRPAPVNPKKLNDVLTKYHRGRPRSGGAQAVT